MKWIKENTNIALASLLTFSASLISPSLFAVETISPGNISSIVYAADGVNFKLKQVDGTGINDSGVCGGNDTFHLSSIHTNYKAALGAVVSSHAAKEFITLTLDGCNGNNALITSLEIGTQPVPPIVTGLMSIDLVNGNGAYQEVVTNIDSSSNEVMVVTKTLDTEQGFGVFDTLRGTTASVDFNSNAAQTNIADALTTFRVDGHAVSGSAFSNAAATDYLHWTMKSNPGNFDIVKYTGTGAANQVVHDLAGEVGMILIKDTSSPNDWIVWHRSLNQSSNEYLVLNSKSAKATATNVFSQAPSTSNFTVGSSAFVNTAGRTYVAYIFAHNNTNQIFTGSFTGTGGSGNKQTIGFKPQLILLKDASGFGGFTFMTVAQQAGDTWWKYYNLGDTSIKQYSFSTAINVLDDGFSFTGSSGNWSGGEIIFLAIGDPQ